MEQDAGVEFKYIQPGKPTQNAYIERFNRTYRQDVLDSCLFDSIEEVRDENEKWMQDYNYQRPHDALGGLPLVMWKYRQQQAGTQAQAAPDHIPTSDFNNNNEFENLRDKSTLWIVLKWGAYTTPPDLTQNPC